MFYSIINICAIYKFCLIFLSKQMFYLLCLRGLRGGTRKWWMKCLPSMNSLVQVDVFYYQTWQNWVSGTKGVKIRGTEKKKLGVLKGKMIIKNEILGLNRCFLIPNMTELKSGKKEPIYAERCVQKNYMLCRWKCSSKMNSLDSVDVFYYQTCQNSIAGKKEPIYAERGGGRVYIYAKIPIVCHKLRENPCVSQITPNSR